MGVLVEQLNIGARACKRLHLWKGGKDRGKKRRRCLLLAVELIPLFKAQATFRLSLKGRRLPIAGSFHSRYLGRVALSTFSQPQIFNKDHATLMILIFKYLILVTRVSQELQSGVFENFLFSLGIGARSSGT